MRNLKTKLEDARDEARIDVAGCMDDVRTASDARDMMRYAMKLIKAQLHLEALERTNVEDLQRDQEKAKHSISFEMSFVNSSTTAKEMISRLYSLTEYQIRLEALESLFDDEEEEWMFDDEEEEEEV